MTSSYTTNLRLTLQGDGDNPSTWGEVCNDQVINLIEAAISGVASIDCTGSSNIDLSASTQNGAPDNARNAVLQLSGTLGANIQVIVPAVTKLYAVNGLWSGNYTITILPKGATTGLTLTSGQLILCYTNGSTIYEVASSTPLGALLQTNNLSDVSSASTARTNLGLGSLATQNANNVNITGGTISGISGLVGAVSSVAGKTGAVTLTASDISGLGALATAASSISAGTTGKLVFGAVTVQWGTGTASSSGSGATNTFGTPFSGTPYYVNFIANSSTMTAFTTGDRPSPATNTWTSTGFNALSDGGTNITWLAIGPT